MTTLILIVLATLVIVITFLLPASARAEWAARTRKRAFKQSLLNRKK